MDRIMDGNPDIGKNVISKELIKIVADTAKHTVNGAAFPTGPWKEAEYFYNLTVFDESGGANAITIDVKIQTYDPVSGEWRDAMVFQQVSCAAAGSETTQEYKRLASNLGVQQRVQYVTGGAGTIADCSFTVGAVYKR